MNLTGISLWVLLTVLLSAVWPQASYAQERRGLFSFGIGGGPGWADANCDGCDKSDRAVSGAASINFGLRLKRRVVVGAEVNFWTKEGDDATLDIYNVSGTVTFYPQGSSGFFLKGGVGASSLDAEVESTATIDLGTAIGLAHVWGIACKSLSHGGAIPQSVTTPGSPPLATGLADRAG